MGLGGVFTEASMAVPIGEYLATKYGSEVQSEVAHPLFDVGRRGRPKQLDFVRKKRGEHAWHAAYESKFQHAGFKGIIEDLCRLVCLAQAEGIGRPRRYFIFAAETSPGSALLDNSFNTGDGNRIRYFDKILKREEGEDEPGSFGILELHEKQVAVFKSFSEANDVKLPSRMITKLAGFSRNTRYTCAAWDVTAVSGSKLLSAKELTT